MHNKLMAVAVVILVGAGAGVALTALGCGAGQDASSPEQGEIYKIQNPLAEVEVGEWVLYRLGDGNTMRLEVLAVHPATRAVTVREEFRNGKTNTQMSDVTRDIMPNHFLWGFEGVGAMVAQIYEDPIEVGGRKFKSFCVETSGGVSQPLRHWYSPEIPVIGMIRQSGVKGGPAAVKCELIDWSGRER